MLYQPFHSLIQFVPLLNTYIAWYMHGLECLDFQLMLATCLEVLRTSCYSIKSFPLLLGLAHYIVKPNTYLGRAKERWMKSLASDLLRACKLHLSAHARGRTYVRTYLLGMRIIELQIYTAVFRLVVQKSRRESTHAHSFGGDFELKILRMRGFSSRFLDNQPENCCTPLFTSL